VNHSSGLPRVSIGFPVYNGERYLETSLESLLTQTLDDFELIICDNASTDRTEEICRSYAASDERILYRRNPQNIGGMKNANLTFSLSRAPYFRWAADDDICAPTLLERLVDELDQRPDASVCLALSVAIDADGAPLPRSSVGTVDGRRHSPGLMTDEHGIRFATEGTASRANQRFRELVITRHACEATYGIIRSDVLRKTMLLGDYTSSDRVLLAELALHGPFHVVPEPLFYKRYHPGNIYSDLRAKMSWVRPELVDSGRPTLPNWLELGGYARAVKRSPISWNEKLLCLRWLTSFAFMRYQPLGWDLVHAAVVSVQPKTWCQSLYRLPEPAAGEITVTVEAEERHSVA
jgi:glycosyltransferase involved in cell wall biosynthesis